MLKKFVSLLLIYSVFLLSSFSTGAFAQSLSNVPKKEQVSQKTDVKKAFSKETSKSKIAANETSVDFSKIEKDQYKKSRQSTKMNKKQVALIVVIVAAIVVGAIILAKYVHVPKCSQVDCDPDFDESCICED